MKILLILLCIISAVVAFSAPLKLTIASDRPVLLATAVAQNAEAADATRYQVSPVTLSLTFTNQGNVPIKLYLYNLYMNGLTLHINGPLDSSVKSNVLDIGYKPAWATPANFPSLAAGESYTVPVTFSIPGVFGKTSYHLKDLGDYRISFSYRYTPAKGIDIFEQPEEA